MAVGMIVGFMVGWVCFAARVAWVALYEPEKIDKLNRRCEAIRKEA